MKRKWAAVLATVLAAVFVLQAVPAAAADGDSVSDYGENAQCTMYVSFSGSDETGNGTQASPWKTSVLVKNRGYGLPLCRHL